ncbi:MAG: hypothetical protein JNK92_04810 [Dechloromonas sp.]|nr:hypothetical protein [Dechloromonas sp.]
MKKLLQLRIELSSAPQPITGFDRFIQIAANEGLAVEAIRIDSDVGNDVSYKEMLETIRNAHGYWITDPYLFQNPGIRTIVESRLAEGALAFALPRFDSELGAEFYQDLGIEATPIRAVRVSTPSDEGLHHPMLMRLSMETYPFGFRDPVLFQGVREVLLQQANGIGCFGIAQTILAIPSDQVKLLDVREDSFVGNIPRPELSVVVSSSRSDWRGRVIASSAGLFHDPYVGPLGDQFPGISAGDNAIFARNLLRAIASGTASEVHDWLYVYSLISQIEIGVSQVTDTTLSRVSGDGWFHSRVPESIVKKCTERRSSESQTFPVAAYLDLIDFKSIWKACWADFEPLLLAVGLPSSKTSALRFLQEVNEVRKPAMHPNKRFHIGIPEPSKEQVSKLQEYARLTASLAEASRTRHL